MKRLPYSFLTFIAVGLTQIVWLSGDRFSAVADTVPPAAIESQAFANFGDRTLTALPLLPAMPMWRGKSLRDIALEMARNHANEPKPTSAKFVATTRQRAACLDGNGDRVDSNEVVYLIVMKGDFELVNAFVPDPAIVPRGRNLAFTVNAETGEIEDLVLNDLRGDLTKLGIVRDLLN